MAGPAQNTRTVGGPRTAGPLRWSGRFVQEGLIVSVLAVLTAALAAVVSSKERGTLRQQEGMLEGLELLQIERELSVVATRFITTTTMHMYAGGRADEIENEREAFRRGLEAARSELVARPPSDGWRSIHDEMSTAVALALGTFHRPRSNSEVISWADEFLYDFKRVVPTDNLGKWSSLLETATWAQEVPMVVRDYLDFAMARLWADNGLPPVDLTLLDHYQFSMASLRRIRDSHGEDAESYTPFEEYILMERAEETGAGTVTILERLREHPAVRQIEADMPFLLGLSGSPAFGNVEELYERVRPWLADLEQEVERLRLHAAGRLDASIARSRRNETMARFGGGIGVILAFILAGRIVRRRRQDERRLRTALERDVLTGLYNRYALFEEAPGRLADPSWGHFGLVHLDLDDFKSINDECGHHIGDAALEAFADALQGAVRSELDMVARIGGDEFVVLLYRLEDPVAGAERIVERLRERLEQPLELGGRKLVLYFSAGVAVAHEPVDLEELLVEADLALLEAKNRGQQEARFFRRKLGRTMIRELATALEAGELRCAFQPQLALESGVVIGLEAFLRWQRDDRADVPAKSLIDAIEWLGESDRWLRLAMRDVEAAWRQVGDRFDGRIWLNMSGATLGDVGAKDILATLGATEVPLSRLGVELTDPALRASRGNVAAGLRELQAAGVAVALDDVGDDRVPILNVTELPIDVVKLDRCLVAGLDSQAQLRAVVESLVGLCDRLQLRVVAEGVETIEEEAVLRRLGVRYVQGYRFAKPLPISALIGFFDQPGLAQAAGDV